MSYALDPDHSPGREIARIVQQQAARIADSCPTAGGDMAVFVHKARVRCKKIRAALRLGRGLMGDKAWQRENRWWRDAARGLSGIRDLSARIEALDAVARYIEPELGRAPVMRLRGRFETEREAAQSGSAGDAAVEAFCTAVTKRLDHLTAVREGGDGEDVADALAEGYAAGRRAMKSAEREGTPEALHEWRKRAKAHALQMRLARRLFPVVEDRIAAAKAFADILGELQDIEVLSHTLENAGEDKVIEVLDRRRLTLEGEAWTSGRALFADKTKLWAAGIESADRREGAASYRPIAEAS